MAADEALPEVEPGVAGLRAVADLVDRYWTPAPPWEEQVANLRRATPANGAGAGPR